MGRLQLKWQTEPCCNWVRAVNHFSGEPWQTATHQWPPMTPPMTSPYITLKVLNFEPWTLADLMDNPLKAKFSNLYTKPYPLDLFDCNVSVLIGEA